MIARHLLGGAAAALLLAALALTGTAPAFAAPPDGKGGGGGKPSAAQQQYAAIGDSYAAGQGGGSPIETGCWRDRNGYPSVLDADRKLPVQLVAFTACAGADTTAVIANQVGAIPTNATRVTLTAGGNDVGFATVMQNCFVWVVVSACEASIAAGDALVDGGQIEARIAAVVDAAQARSGTAVVIVTGYPLLFDAASGYRYAQRVNESTTRLNDAIQRGAEGAGAVFVDVEPAFTGHGVGSSAPWIRGVQIFDAGSSFHPNASGYAAYASLLAPLVR